MAEDDEKKHCYCDLCGEFIEESDFKDGIAFRYEDGCLHEKCREEYFGTR